MSDASAAGAAARGPGHAAALAARNAVEAALFAFAEIPLDFDREGLKDRLLGAIRGAYAALDNPVVAAAHLDGLREGAAICGESRILLARSGDPAEIPTLRGALDQLAAAEAAFRSGAEAVTQIQLARRTELIAGRPADALPPPRPFRAGKGLPELHALARPPLLPLVRIEAAEPLAEAPPPPVTLPRPTTIEELEAFSAGAATGALEKRFMAEEAEAPAAAATEPLPFAYEPAVEEVELLRRLTRDCLDDIAASRNLRKPNALETWLDQAPFEQRLLCDLDAFAAAGNTSLQTVSLFHAEAKSPDAERSFAVALALGSIEGSDTVAAALMTLKQSAPETHEGWIEGFSLAPSPAIDEAMADLCTGPRADLAALALEVLLARGGVPDALVRALLPRADPGIDARLGRALAASLPADEAISALEALVARSASDEAFLAAAASLLCRRHELALDHLRDAARRPPSPARALGALRLLAFAGGAGELPLLLDALSLQPSATLARALGRFGHAEALPALLALLPHEEIGPAAAEALDRITGAGLREIIEEPWELDLPPELLADQGIAAPTRKIERIIQDPDRWAAWLRDAGPRLDPKLKLRGGAPFSPLRIVDELESRAAPPQARQDAAQELALVTGIVSPFSPHDWVARQELHLAALREQVSARSFPAGAWLVGGARHLLSRSQGGLLRPAASPAPPRPVLPFTPTAPAAGAGPPITTTLPPLSSDAALPFLPPPPAQAAPPAWPSAIGAIGAVRTETGELPPDLVARLANALPFRPKEPEASPPPPLDLERYAALCAELSLSPAQSEAIFQRYGLDDRQQRQSVDQAWRERLQTRPDEYRTWQALYQRHLTAGGQRR